MTYFLDTSALVKLYHRERGSAELERYLDEAGEELFLAIAGITPLEFRSAFYRRVRMGELTQKAMAQFLEHFQHDLQYIETITFSRPVFQKASSLMDQSAATEAFRTLDAIQLASAVIWNQTVPIDVFISSDATLLQVAGQNFPTFNPMEAATSGT